MKGTGQMKKAIVILLSIVVLAIFTSGFIAVGGDGGKDTTPPPAWTLEKLNRAEALAQYNNPDPLFK